MSYQCILKTKIRTISIDNKRNANLMTGNGDRVLERVCLEVGMGRKIDQMVIWKKMKWVFVLRFIPH